MEIVDIPQKELEKMIYGAELDLFNPVDCVSIKEVFTPEEVEKIRSFKGFECHECHSNSSWFCLMGSLNLKGYVFNFCEGLLNQFASHCWNKVVRLRDGKEFYVDITSELVNNRNVTENHYLLYTEWTDVEIIKLFNKHESAFIPLKGTFSGKKYVKYDKRAGTVVEEWFDKKNQKQVTKTKPIEI